MKRPQALRTVILLVLVAQMASGCGPAVDQPSPQPSQSKPSSAAPTKNVASTVDVQIVPAPGSQSARQKAVSASFFTLINAQYRFYSHPWIVDPVYIAAVLPGSGNLPLDTDTVGMVGPVRIQVLSIEASTAAQATVTYCSDDRALRYLGQDGTVDVVGPNGKRRVGDVALESRTFALTTDAAVDGSTSKTPRWLAASGTFSANAKECQALAKLPPLPSPSKNVTSKSP